MKTKPLQKSNRIYQSQLLSINEAMDALTMQFLELTRRKMELERKIRFAQINTERVR